MKYDKAQSLRIAEFKLAVYKAWNDSECSFSEYGLALSQLLQQHMEERIKYAKPKSQLKPVK